MKIWFAAPCVAAALLLGACASVTRGHVSQVHFTSNPAGAEVKTSIGFSCVTPCAFPANRKEEFSVVFSKAGYEPQEVVVKTRVAAEGVAAGLGNALIGGVVGLAVDAYTGATLEHCPNPVAVILRPVRQPATGRGRQVVAPAPVAVADEAPRDPAAHCIVTVDPNAVRNDAR